jgi:hypothetical protein
MKAGCLNLAQFVPSFPLPRNDKWRKDDIHGRFADKVSPSCIKCWTENGRTGGSVPARHKMLRRMMRGDLPQRQAQGRILAARAS